MPQKRANKEQRLHKSFNPVFTNASTFYHSQKIPEITTSIQDTLNPSSSPQISEIQEKLNFYRQKAMVPNTERSTRNWVAKFEEFRKSCNYTTSFEEITDSKLIEQQVCEYIAQMTKKTSGEYKANSVKQAVDAINRHLVKVSPIRGINLHDKYEFSDLFTVLHGKMKDLQEKGFGEKEGSMALTAQQVQEILADDFLNPNTPEGLLYRVFFRIATNFACRGGEHYNLHVDQFQFLSNDSLLFCRYRSKNNQRGIEGGAAQNIHLPPNSESANDIKKYLSKRSSGASKNFYLHINPLWRETGIWYKQTHYGSNKVGNFMKDIEKSVKVELPFGLLTNHSGRKTVAQILQDANIPEDAIMGVTGHKSIQGIRAYKEVNKKQHLAAMDTLINAIEPSRSILTDSTSKNANVDVQPKISSSIFTTTSEFSSANDIQKKLPIFNNCHFNNVTFKL